jgi:Ecdysteroid kinase-like family
LPEYLVHCSGGPHTLAHGDFRPDNFAFSDAGGKGAFIVFDWQVSRRSHGARDLAYILAGSMETEQRRGNEKSLLDLYHETLLANGIEGYSSGDLKRDYVMGLGAPLNTAIVAGGMLDFSSERGTELFRQASQRLGAALEDHHFVELLRDLAS